MIRVGLTGGIGAGKSTVARMLAECGAVVVDGDQIARELVAPGGDALDEVVERFGAGVLTPEGTLDRSALADLVFPDPQALSDLERIMHPRIAHRAEEMLRDAEQRGVLVAVYDMPLLVETGQADDFDVVVVVQASVAVRLARLAVRGVRVADAKERMDRQATDEQRAAVADLVIDNSGDEAELAAAVERVWRIIVAAGE